MNALSPSSCRNLFSEVLVLRLFLHGEVDGEAYLTLAFAFFFFCVVCPFVLLYFLVYRWAKKRSDRNFEERD
jgi:hypothetical protein